MVFKDISKFNNISDYLPILSSIIIIDLIFQLALYYGLFKSKMLNFWYKEFKLSAVISDVAIIFIGFIIARWIYSYFYPNSEFSLLKFIIILVVVQVIHDILFYILLIKPLPKGYNQMFDAFKKYADEHSYKSIIGDTLMMIFSAILASILANYSTNTNIIILVITLYAIPYTLFTNYLK
jgi:hypothetical protein